MAGEVLDSQDTMEMCRECKERPVSDGLVLCVACSKTFVSKFEAMLKNKSRKYFEATMLGLTTERVLFLTDDDEFTAFIVMTPKKLNELRIYLNEICDDGTSND